MISATNSLFSSKIFKGSKLFSNRFFMLKNFSSPNLFFKKSLKSTLLLGDAGVLLGLKIVSVKLKVLGLTFFVGKFFSFILVFKSASV